MMTAAPPPKEEEEEEEANDDDNHPMQQYVVPAHISGSTFSVWIFHQAKNNNFFNPSVMFQGNKKFKFNLLNTKQTQKAMYRLWAKTMLNQQSIIQNF